MIPFRFVRQSAIGGGEPARGSGGSLTSLNGIKFWNNQISNNLNFLNTKLDSIHICYFTSFQRRRCSRRFSHNSVHICERPSFISTITFSFSIRRFSHQSERNQVLILLVNWCRSKLLRHFLLVLCKRTFSSFGGGY